jgi:hypothetical protein
LAEIIGAAPRGQADLQAPLEQVPMPAMREVVPSTVVISPGHVTEPPELFQLKCPSRTLKGSNTLKQE